MEIKEWLYYIGAKVDSKLTNTHANVFKENCRLFQLKDALGYILYAGKYFHY